MSEFRKAFYVNCPIHKDVEHPLWRKCPKCETIINYSETDVFRLVLQAENLGYMNATRYCEEGFQASQTDINDWFELNKKK